MSIKKMHYSLGNVLRSTTSSSFLFISGTTGKTFSCIKIQQNEKSGRIFFVCVPSNLGWISKVQRGRAGAEGLWGSQAPSGPDWEPFTSNMKRLGWGRGSACLTSTSVAELCRHSLSRETHFFPNTALAAQQSDNNYSITVTNLYQNKPYLYNEREHIYYKHIVLCGIDRFSFVPWL